MKKDWRRLAREAALQILYLRDVGDVDLDRAVETLFAHQWPDEGPPPDNVRELALTLARETVTRLDAIDELIAATTERWRPDRMPVVDRLILRMAVGELLSQPTPQPVVINEALELARTFSTEDAVKFINGMLDAIRQKLAQPQGS